MIRKRLVKIPRTLLQLYEEKDLQLPPHLVSIKAPECPHGGKKKLTTLSVYLSPLPPERNILKRGKIKAWKGRKDEKFV